MKKSICALIAVRAGSKRVINKNVRSFAKKSLLEIKIESIKKVDEIQEVYVSSDDDYMLKIAKNLGAIPIKRPNYYASDLVPMSEVYVHMAENLKCDHIAYLNVTSPLLSTNTLRSCVEMYNNMSNSYDSLATVNVIREYMWLDGKAINYDPKNHPRSQDLPEIHGLNFAACILPRLKMIEKRNIIGDNFYKFVTSQEESIDIDTMLDFKIAEFLYNNREE
jgi:CMP-N-acetylneuraminic acid synthetase